MASSVSTPRPETLTLDQEVDPLTLNQRVRGSSPRRSTSKIKYLQAFGARQNAEIAPIVRVLSVF